MSVFRCAYRSFRFYTDWRDYELEELVDSLQTNREQSVSYPLLDVRISYVDDKPDQHYFALNESTIKRPIGRW